MLQPTYGFRMTYGGQRYSAKSGRVTRSGGDRRVIPAVGVVAEEETRVRRRLSTPWRQKDLLYRQPHHFSFQEMLRKGMANNFLAKESFSLRTVSEYEA